MNYIDSLRLKDEGVLYKNTSNILIKYLSNSDLDNMTKSLFISYLKSLDTYVKCLETEASTNYRNLSIANSYPDLITEELRKGGYIKTEKVSQIATNVLGEIIDKIEDSTHPQASLLKNTALKSIAKLILEINGFSTTRETREKDNAK